MDAERGLAIRAAWLAYVGGYTQEVIAERMAISRVKAQRLVASAMENGLVKVFDEGVPAMGGPEQPQSTIAALAVAAARSLHRLLGKGDLHTVGIGHGRTLAAMVERLPSLQLPGTRFVSVLGSLTRRSSANPYDVIAKLAERTG